MTNAQVVQAWIKGQRASTGRLKTDGKDLYSDDLKIGEKLNKLYIVWEYSMPNQVKRTGVFVSQATHWHVRLALHHVGKSVNVNGIVGSAVMAE